MLAASLALLLWLLAYAALCAAQPFARCRKCNGLGYHPTGKRGRKPCRRCKATGRRLRIGRRIYNGGHRLHRDGNR